MLKDFRISSWSYRLKSLLGIRICSNNCWTRISGNTSNALFQTITSHQRLSSQIIHQILTLQPFCLGNHFHHNMKAFGPRAEQSCQIWAYGVLHPSVAGADFRAAFIVIVNCWWDILSDTWQSSPSQSGNFRIPQNNPAKPEHSIWLKFRLVNTLYPKTFATQGNLVAAVQKITRRGRRL